MAPLRRRRVVTSGHPPPPELGTPAAVLMMNRKLTQQQLGRMPADLAQRLAAMGLAPRSVPLPEDWPAVEQPRPASVHVAGRRPLYIRPGAGGGEAAASIAASLQQRRQKAEKLKDDKLKQAASPAAAPSVGGRRPRPQSAVAAPKAAGMSPQTPTAPKPPVAPRYLQSTRVRRGLESAKSRRSRSKSGGGRPSSRPSSAGAAAPRRRSARSASRRRRINALLARRRRPSGLGLERLLQHGPSGNGERRHVSVEAAVDLLKLRNFFDDTVTAEMVQMHLEGLSDGSVEPVLVAGLEPNRTSCGVTDTQFLSMLDWVARKRHVTFSEVVGKLVHCRPVEQRGRPKTRVRRSMWRRSGSRSRASSRRSSRRRSSASAGDGAARRERSASAGDGAGVLLPAESSSAEEDDEEAAGGSGGEGHAWWLNPPKAPVGA